MKAVVTHKFHTSVKDVHVSNISRPEPKPDEILIQVIAAGVNFVDTLYAQGKHQNNRSLVLPPFTLGLEYAGIVVSSPSTSPFQPGDAVFGDYSGSYSEFIVIPPTSTSIQKIPKGWSFTDAAGLGATLPVSYGALLRGGLKKGETVLVHSAAGGLGVMAVQIAAAMGCKVIGTAGSREKCAYAKTLGADAVIDYSKGDDWWKKVLDETGGKGVDVVFDPVGLVDLSIKCIAHRGRVLIVGFAGRDSASMEKIAMNRVLLKQVHVIGYRYGESLRRNPQERQDLWDGLDALLEQGKIKPTVTQTYDNLEKVPQALLDIMDRKIAGKAVVKVQPDTARL